MIFFLDMDGVLNNVRVAMSQPEQYMHNNFGWIDPICVQFINNWAAIIKDKYDEDTYIVLTSTWRSPHENHTTVSMMLSVMGIMPLAHKDFKTRYTGMTIDGVHDIRGNQINDWLDDHPDETHWIIIDDDSDFTEEQKLRHIHTDGENGILYSHHIQFEEIVEQIYNGDI